MREAPTRFFGRDDELAAVTRIAAHAAPGGSSAAALIVGLPGVGKTALIDHACRVAELPILSVRGHEPERDVPLSGARDMLRQLAHAPSSGPKLMELLEGDPAGGPLLAVRLFEAAHRCLSERPSSLVVIDDLQWVDALTIAMCHYLIRAADGVGAPLVLLAAGRSAPAVAEFGASLARLLPDGRFTVLGLDPLPRDVSLSLVRSLAPLLSDSDAQVLVDRSGGSPFWLRFLAIGGRAGGLAEAMAEEISALGLDASTVAGLLAVSGRALAIDDLAAVLEWPPGRAGRAVDELELHGLASRHGDGLALSHDLLSQAIRERLDPGRLATFHGRLSGWLEQTGQGRLWEALSHRAAAGLDCLALAAKLVGSREGRLMGSEGLRRLAAIADAQELSSPAVAELQSSLARIASELGEHEFAYQRSTSLTEHWTEPVERARAALAASRAALALNRAADAEWWLGVAESAGAGELALDIELKVQRGLLLRWLGHSNREARRHTREAVEDARRLAAKAGGPELMDTPGRAAHLSALRAAFDTAFLAERIDQAEALSDEMTAAVAGAHEEELKASITTALLARQVGRFSEAEARLRAVLTTARQKVLPLVEVEAAFWLAAQLHSLGRLREADEAAQAAWQLGKRVGTPVRMSPTWLEALTTVINMSLSHWQPQLERLTRLAGEEPDAHYRLLLLIWQATWMARLRGAPALADLRTVLVRGQLDAGEAGCDRCRRELTLRCAEALARTRAADEAAELLADWDGAGAGGYALATVYRKWAGALLVEAQGSLGQALSQLTAVEGIAGEIGMAHEQLWLGLDRARMLSGQDRAAGIAAYRSALDAAVRASAATEAQLAERGLRELGVRAWRRSPAGLQGLSQRELEVAGLVAAGSSNPEIAEELFLSRKTVERHVSNVLTKLDLRNRAQLAARLADLLAAGGSQNEGSHR